MKRINVRNLKTISLLISSWSKMVKNYYFYHDVGILFLVLFIVVGLGPSICLSETDEIKPKRGVAFIDAVLDANHLLIDEYRYIITPLTRFYKQNGTTSERDRFSEGMLVCFIADERGNLLSLREEYDIEGEFDRKKPNTMIKSRPLPRKQGFETKRKKPTSSLHLENGVWKN